MTESSSGLASVQLTSKLVSSLSTMVGVEGASGHGRDVVTSVFEATDSKLPSNALT